MPIPAKIASIELVAPTMGPIRIALHIFDHVSWTVEFARKENVMKTLSKVFRNTLGLALQKKHGGKSRSKFVETTRCIVVVVVGRECCYTGMPRGGLISRDNFCGDI